jgi:hypothetical protein
MKEWIRKNIFKWTLSAIRTILVAYFSYYLLKVCAEVGFIKGVWSSNERWYLASYATIQVIVTFVLYTGFGKLFELMIYRWIRKNENEMVIELEKDDEKELKKGISKILHFLKFFNVIHWEDLVEFEEINLDKEEFRKKWKNIVEIIKGVAGVLVLALTNLLIFNGSSILFIWLLAVFIALAVLSFFALLFFYILIENLHFIDAYFKGISSTGRLLRKNDVQNRGKIH